MALSVCMLAACPFPASHGTPGSIREMAEAVGGLGHDVHLVTYHAVAHLPAWLQCVLYRGLGRGLDRFEARVRYGMIDWPVTEAFFDENPYFPVLRVNLKGRQPRGTVEPGGPYKAVRDRLIRALLAGGAAGCQRVPGSATTPLAPWPVGRLAARLPPWQAPPAPVAATRRRITHGHFDGRK